MKKKLIIFWQKVLTISILMSLFALYFFDHSSDQISLMVSKKGEIGEIKGVVTGFPNIGGDRETTSIEIKIDGKSHEKLFGNFWNLRVALGDSVNIYYQLGKPDNFCVAKRNYEMNIFFHLVSLFLFSIILSSFLIYIILDPIRRKIFGLKSFKEEFEIKD